MIEPLDVFIGSPRVRRDAHTVIHLPDNVKFQRPILLQPQALCRHIPARSRDKAGNAGTVRPTRV